MGLRWSNTAVRTLVLGALLAAVPTPQARGLEITFDTTHDTGFFGTGTQGRAVLDAAGAFFETMLGDELQAITPNASNSWRAFYANPTTNGPQFAIDLVIPEDTLLVFVGSRAMGGQLGKASPGTATLLSGDAAWAETLAHRGEGSSDFGPWGGSLAVASDVSWDYSLTGTNPTDYSLYSNILHEMGHVLGVGIASSWFDDVSAGNLFTGEASEAIYGGSVPLESDDGHWLDGTTSTIYGGTASGEVSLDPSLALGAFKPYTELDVAGLEDIGWVTVPEPSTALALVLGLSLSMMRRRRRLG